MGKFSLVLLDVDDPLTVPAFHADLPGGQS